MAKLNKKERDWIDRLNAVLAECPSPEKIGFFTIGDNSVGLYDLRHDDEISATDDDLVRVAQRNGWLFDETIEFPSSVNGVCG
ncbi:hypothetical protein [Serratia entomophila]|uniref:hypothetical protein n=1 Tax=Serratia entomophila TaxID=42906 RepID=UPI0021788F45|nr:hypothetical protein [Serratia entomophila]CAI0829742.1 Uncharacterised protein [Serratia entomophila]CAI1653646.1 Uncharacterised protein [Serratia entomophila]CAI1921298.1 Uncharacterised protein [Serratia entomophila]